MKSTCSAGDIRTPLDAVYSKSKNFSGRSGTSGLSGSTFVSQGSDDESHCPFFARS